jgi:hypothetical protein
MKLAILFWFYKQPEICKNRLLLLRRYNPTVQIYGLYGGDPADAATYESALGPHLDDLYAFDEHKESSWKWYHGDQMISRWHTQRGSKLDWDTIFVAQWDMLVFGRVERLFRGLRKGELLLSGLRPVKEVESWWSHLREGSDDRERYLRFLGHVRSAYGFRDEPLCGEVIVLCLPRQFLDQYAQIRESELGFLEYKIPIYAQIFGTPFCSDHPYSPWWGDDPKTGNVGPLGRSLNAEGQEVPLRTVVAHLASPWGGRIFHPVFRSFPAEWIQLCRAVWREVIEEELKPRWWRLCRRWTARSR